MDSSVKHITRTTCRICGSSELVPELTLGNQYISDFVDPGKAYSGPRCPIDIVYCRECTLVQNPHTAPQELLYSGHYWYRSGVTDTMKRALQDVAAAAQSEVELEGGDLILDIGSNDGTLLKFFPEKYVRVGVEPAYNMAQYYDESIHLISDFWGKEKVSNEAIAVVGSAKVITALGMFYDLEDPNNFVSEIAKVLHPDGVFIAQLMCLKNMLNTLDVGNLAHEHLEFYTLQSLDYLLNAHGLEIYNIETNSVNGESYRLYIQHQRGPRPTSSSVPLARFSESHILNDLREFVDKLDVSKARIREFIKTEVMNKRKSVWVYGASTKGNTILQWLELDDWLIGGASERTPEKIGKVTAGSNIQIYSEEEARLANPSYFLVLPVAFLAEFVERELAWRHRGGKFIQPLPSFRII